MRFGALVLLLALFAAAAFAQETSLCDFAASLPAEIYVEPAVYNQSPTIVHATVVVENDGTDDWVLRLVRVGDGQCEEIKALKVIQPGARETVDLDFETTYAGEQKKNTRYAIVATGSEIPLGKYFYVAENWAGYERQTHDMLNSLALFFVPVAAVILIIIIMLMAEWAYSSKASGEFDNEYTVKTLFFPMLRNRPGGELVADVLISPFFWLLEMLVVGVMAGIIWNSVAVKYGTLSGTIILISLAGALFVPVVYFAIVWYFNEMFERKPMRFFAAAFFWGMSAALLSLVLNSYGIVFLKSHGITDNMIVAFIITAALAPIVEEFAKGIGLLGLFGHHEYDDSLNGLLIGFSIGLGFAFIENWFYFSSRVNPFEVGIVNWGFLALYRTFFNSIAHGCFTAALGAALGWAKTQKLRQMANLSFIPGLQLAVALHVIFNITAILDSFAAMDQQIPVFIFNPTLVLTLLGIMFVVFTISLLHARVRVMRGRPFELMLKGLDGDSKGDAMPP